MRNEEEIHLAKSQKEQHIALISQIFKRNFIDYDNNPYVIHQKIGDEDRKWKFAGEKFRENVMNNPDLTMDDLLGWIEVNARKIIIDEERAHKTISDPTPSDEQKLSSKF